MLKFLSNTKVNRLNRRQRKKHYVGEFKEVMFYFRVYFRNLINYTDIDDLVDALIDFGDQNRFEVFCSIETKQVDKFDFAIAANNVCFSGARTCEVVGLLFSKYPNAQVRVLEGPDACYGDFDNFDEDQLIGNHLNDNVHVFG